jgi:membrane protein
VVGAVKEFQDDRIQEVAAGVTFYSLLAVFPAIAAFVSLYGLFADTSDVARHIAVLAGVLPPDIAGFVATEMQRLADARQGGLGVAFAASLALSIWSAHAGLNALFSGLNIAYEVREHRNWFVKTGITLAFTAGALVLAVMAILAANARPLAILALVPAWLAQAVGVVVMLVALMLALAAVYRYGPSRDAVRWRWVSPGSIVAILAWFAMSFAFSWYVGHMAHYERTYGSLGAAIAFMVWLWLTITVLLFGAELNAEVELRTKGLPPDETRAPGKPGHS